MSHADDLAQLREMPVEIELQGGEADGSRVWVPKDMTTYLVPLQPELGLFVAELREPARMVSIRCAVYHWRGSIADDGARRFVLDHIQE